MEAQSILDCLRDSLLGELQRMRESVCEMEEKVDYLVLERLELHKDTAAVGKLMHESLSATWD
jgi:K+/H+ antiporter YhaU regulatory subunit KhtT